jgi:hypothetical protein
MMFYSRLCITGSRHWTDEDTIRAWLDHLTFQCVIIHGACPRGADAIVDRVARSYGRDEIGHFRIITFPVDTVLDGPWPSAGPKRNERMLVESVPDRVWAFRASGKSNGTDDCVRRAEARGIPVTTIRPGDRP